MTLFGIASWRASSKLRRERSMSRTVDVSRDPMRDWLARAASFLVFWLKFLGHE
jgi:hypothetical protein